MSTRRRTVNDVYERECKQRLMTRMEDRLDRFFDKLTHQINDLMNQRRRHNRNHQKSEDEQSQNTFSDKGGSWKAESHDVVNEGYEEALVFNDDNYEESPISDNGNYEEAPIFDDDNYEEAPVFDDDAEDEEEDVNGDVGIALVVRRSCLGDGVYVQDFEMCDEFEDELKMRDGVFVQDFEMCDEFEDELKIRDGVFVQDFEVGDFVSANLTKDRFSVGRALCIALAQKGIYVRVADFSKDKGKEVVSILLKENLKFHPGLKYPSSIFVKCDVTNKEQVAAAFEKHVEVYGGLDICINSAGILSFVPFHMDQTDGSRSWRHAVNVNFVGVIDCTHRAIKIMEAAKKPVVIINMGSAAGLYPMITDPIYSSTKGGVVMFTRALAPYKGKGIRVNVICPEIVGTDMGETTESRYIEKMGGYISMNTMIQGTFELITDESKAGFCLWITNCRGLEYWPTPVEEAKYLLPSSKTRKRISSSAVPSTVRIPQSIEKVIVH